MITMNNLSGLYVITSPLIQDSEKLYHFIEVCITSGANLIQYRDKSDNEHKQYEQASVLNDLCRTHHVPLIINDHVKLAKKINAGGVHVGQTDLQTRHVREYLGNDFIIGTTCHSSLQLAQKAESDGANYVAFGRFFPSKTKPLAPPASLCLLQNAKQNLSIPICAIGGITPENAETVYHYGADMIAVISGIYQQPDIKKTVYAYVSAREEKI